MIHPSIKLLDPQQQAIALKKQAEVYTELAMAYEQAAEILARGGELTADLAAELAGEQAGQSEGDSL